MYCRANQNSQQLNTFLVAKTSCFDTELLLEINCNDQKGFVFLFLGRTLPSWLPHFNLFSFCMFSFLCGFLCCCCLGAIVSIVFCLFACFFPDQQMLSSNPEIYSCSLPDTFQADLPNLQKLCSGSRLPSGPLRRLSKLQSAHGEAFLHFAKSRSFVDGKRKCCYLPRVQTCSGHSVYPLTIFSLRGRKEFQLQK